MEDSRSAFELLQAGDTESLRRLLERNPAACEARDAKGVSLLMLSLYHGHRDLAELIAGKKTVLDIYEAAALGHLDRLQKCIQDALALDPNAINFSASDGFTALHFACFFGQPEAARLLLDNGAKVNVVAGNLTRVMPLHSAVSARNLAAARLLLERGALVNARQQMGWVPIHAAAQNGDLPMLELLLKHRADPTLRNEAGQTPAFVAREKGHEEIALLMEEQAKSW